MDARCELKAAGLPYPRTCPVCKLGQCIRMEKVPKLGPEDTLRAAAVVVREHLSRRVADLVVTGQIPEAKSLTDQPVWRFLGEIIGDVDPTPGPPDSPPRRGHHNGG